VSPVVFLATRMSSSPALVRRRNRRKPGFALQGPDELVAPTRGPGVRAGDEAAQVGDQVVPDDCVPFGLFWVVTDDEPLGSGAVVAVALPAGCDVDLFDPQVARDALVPAGPGQRRISLDVGVPQILGVDVVPTTTSQVRPVRRGGEPAVGDPDHPVQVPLGEVVLDLGR
jgi:hypothetical protein